MVKYICDGCGKEQSASFDGVRAFQPHNWYARADTDGPQHACSRECIDKIASRTGKTSVVIPV